MKVRFTLGAVALTLVSSMAFAGLTVSYPVEVTVNADTSGSAQGNLTAARFSKNSDEYIGCGTRTTVRPDGTVFKYGFCQAGNSAKVTGSCSTTNPDMLDTMKHINEVSYVSFKWDINQECTAVYVSSQSQYIH